VVLACIGAAGAMLVSQSIGRYERRLRQRVDEQRRLNRALDAFSSRVAHDLRSPLGAISMGIELVEADADKLGERSRTALGILQNQTRRAMQLVQDLLDLATAAGTPRPEPIDLTSLVTDAAVEIGDVEVSVEQAPERILADRRALRQALANLLTNAARYATTNGSAEVTVRCDDAGDGWRIAVADRGPGLSTTDVPTLFEPFKRGAAAKAAGTGLGLSIVAAMAEAHGGKAGYEPREGGGSIFWIYLPKTVAVTREPSPSESPDAES
jgi:signal transduction histidine kinase